MEVVPVAEMVAHARALVIATRRNVAVTLTVLLLLCPVILPAQSPIQQWRLNYFGTMNNTNDAADTADPTGDGLPNLVKYVTGLNPSQRERNPMVLSISGGMLHVTVPKNPSAIDAVLAIQTSVNNTNFTGWTTNGMVLDSNTSTALSMHCSVPTTAYKTRFLRLMATNLNFSVPSPPTSYTLSSPAGATVRVSWSAPTNNGGEAIDYYYIGVYTNNLPASYAYVYPPNTSCTLTGLTTASYPLGTVGKSYFIGVLAHSPVGYSAWVTNSIVPKVSYFADNLRGIFSKTYTSGTCISCHNSSIHPNLTPINTADYTNAVNQGTLIYQAPAKQVSGVHTNVTTFTATSLEYSVLQRWVSDGHLQ